MSDLLGFIKDKFTSKKGSSAPLDALKAKVSPNSTAGKLRDRGDVINKALRDSGASNDYQSKVASAKEQGKSYTWNDHTKS